MKKLILIIAMMLFPEGVITGLVTRGMALRARLLGGGR